MILEKNAQVTSPYFRHDKRLAQLDEMGVTHLYRDVRGQHNESCGIEVIEAPPPLIGAIGCKQEFVRRHDSIWGDLPPSGIYRFPICHVGKAGTLFDAERKVLWADDLISDYWMWFVGKIFFREVVDKKPLKQSVVSLFVKSQVAPREIDAGGAPVVIVAKPGVAVYGHWLLDTLPLLWHLYDAARRGRFDDWSKCRFLIGKRTPGWARRMMELLFGIRPDQLIEFDDDNEVVLVRDAVVPGLLRVSPLISARMNSFSDFVIERTRPYRSPDLNLPAEIFISRADFANDKNRLLLNAPEVLKAVEAARITAIMPERLSWPDQVAMFERARIVAGEYGSGMHNSMFGGSRSVPIVFTTKKMNWSQSAIGSLRGQRMIYVQPKEQEWKGVHGLTYKIDIPTVAEAVALARSVG